jgi:FtsZ-binding cell division protein ZapB
MNGPIQRQFDRLHKGLDALESSLAQSAKSQKEQQEAHQDLLQRYWAQSQRVATASRATEEYEALQEENARLRELQQQARDRVQHLLGAAKALAVELRQ